MNQLLTRIIEDKKEEVRRLRDGLSLFPPGGRKGPPRDFKGALSTAGGINLIGEIKFASPSAGRIRPLTDPVSLGRALEKAGAAAISLVTDKKYFSGDIRHLPALKEGVSIPVLRKDFIIDEIQIRESFLFGADAVLLIARILSQELLEKLLRTIRSLGMEALVEVHDREDLEKAVACGARVIGINNRDLQTFSVDLRRTLELAELVPRECVLVSESGIRGGDDVRSLMESPVRAVLVGTALMRSRDVGRKAREIVLGGMRGDDGTS
ncbi:MAG: indole-3-glycerol phosphate synthase TrpC [Deltaproteobacteria bacterium]|nr:indole-3-glycerol phosphate synthase TrpC [Deltaproteobacteria bacterium]MBW2018067.1 indole-3-glycerol phosphate synthase TrpC [Deltaproteobacteria bacterium]MBW2130695.1 indole-3-glycerol phosphate synthase TrpC [Deltaproteobacteria bacterium]MBW2304872.1 indole-3-glycerol phosphate synthase TrpC [Deltaproteobacteria bacterium]